MARHLDGSSVSPLSGILMFCDSLEWSLVVEVLMTVCIGLILTEVVHCLWYLTVRTIVPVVASILYSKHTLV